MSDVIVHYLRVGPDGLVRTDQTFAADPASMIGRFFYGQGAAESVTIVEMSGDTVTYERVS